MAVEKRKRITSKDARQQLDASLDRFQQTIVRKREELLK